MPRIRKPQPSEAERQRAIISETQKIIEKAMIDADIRFYRDAAHKVGLKPSTFTSKLKEGTWTQRDLCNVIRAFGIGEHDALKMLGVGVL